MVKKITIYTTTQCASCGMVKRYLDFKGMKYELINVDEEPGRRAEAIDVSGGAQTVPITVVTKADDSQSVVVGYNLQQLAPALT